MPLTVQIRRTRVAALTVAAVIALAAASIPARPANADNQPQPNGPNTTGQNPTGSEYHYVTGGAGVVWSGQYTAPRGYQPGMFNSYPIPPYNWPWQH
jgi:hypothetical protein